MVCLSSVFDYNDKMDADPKTIEYCSLDKNNTLLKQQLNNQYTQLDHVIKMAVSICESSSSPTNKRIGQYLQTHEQLITKQKGSLSENMILLSESLLHAQTRKEQSKELIDLISKYEVEI